MNADEALDRLNELRVKKLALEVDVAKVDEEHAKISRMVFDALPGNPDSQGVKKFTNRGKVYEARVKSVQPLDEQLPELEL